MLLFKFVCGHVFLFLGPSGHAGCPVNMVPSLTPTLVSRLVLTIPEAAPVVGLLRHHSELKPQEIAGFLCKVEEAAADGHTGLFPCSSDGGSVGIKYLLWNMRVCVSSLGTL